MSASDIAAPPMDLETAPVAAPVHDVPAAAPVPAGSSDLEAELAKWRARVPKLAKALKERTDRVSVLEERLASALGNGNGSEAGVAAGLEARQKLIEELEERQQALKERCHGAEAKLHAQGLALEEAEADVRQWRAKWQELTIALDEQSARAVSAETQALERAESLEREQDAVQQLAAERDQLLSDQANLQAALEITREDLDRLRIRNDQLNETTEFANRQIESLSGSCEQQSIEIRALRETRATLDSTLEAEREQAAATERSRQEEITRQADELARLSRELETSAAHLNRQGAEASVQALAALALTDLLDSTAADLDAERSALQQAVAQAAALATAKAQSDELQAETARALATERTRIEELEARIDELASARDAAQAAWETAETAREAAAAESAALNDTLTELTTECERLQSEIGEFARDRDALRISLKQQRAASRAVTDERDQLQAQLQVQRGRHAAEQASASQTVQRLELEQALQKQRRDVLLAERTALLAQFDGLEAAGAAAAAELQTERNARAVDAAAVQDTETALREAEQSLAEQREALLETQSTVDPQLEAQLEVHLEARSEAEQAVVMLQAECLRIERQLTAEQDELNAARDHNDQISQALVCAQQAHAEIEAQRAQLADRVGLLESEVQYAHSDRVQLERERQHRDVAAAMVLSLEQQLATAAASLPTAAFAEAANDPEFPGVETGAAGAGADADDAATEPAGGERTTDVPTPESTLARMDADGVDKMVLILNQQLSDAHAENERLQARLRKLENNGDTDAS